MLLLKDLLDPPAMLAAGVQQQRFLDLICAQQTAQVMQPLSPQHALQFVWASVEGLC